jgi:hypothetical protein
MAIRVISHPIDTYNKTLVLKGTSLQQNIPYSTTTGRPIGDIDYSVIEGYAVGYETVAGKTRKAKVITHLKKEFHTSPLYDSALISCRKILIFTCIGEEVALVISIDVGGCYEIKTVIAFPIFLYIHRAGNGSIKAASELF